MIEISGRMFKKLKVVLRCVPHGGSGLPILSTLCFRREDGELVIDGTDLNMMARLCTGVDGLEVPFCIPRAVVRAVLEATHVNDVVQITSDEQYVMFQVGDLRIACRPWSIMDFPVRPSARCDDDECARVTLRPSLFLSSLPKDVKTHSVIDDLKGIFVWQDSTGKTYAAAADGYRLAAQVGVERKGAEFEGQTIVLQPHALKAARVKGEVEIIIDLSTSYYRFCYADVTFWGRADLGVVDSLVHTVQDLSVAVLDNKYRKFVIEKPLQLISALRVLRKLYTNRPQEYSESYWSPAGLYLADDEAGVAALYTGVKFEGPRLNPEFLMDLLVAFGVAPITMIFQAPATPVRFTADNLLGVIMPIARGPLCQGSDAAQRARGDLNKFIPDVLLAS